MQELLPAKPSEMVIDRMLNRLSHINPAIVVGASKVILKFSRSLDSPKLVDGLCKKIAGSLTAIMSRSPEIVWVFLRNAEVMLAQFPGVIANPKAFFVNFNDPGYLKIQKVQILGLICDQSATKTIVNELVEYSYDTNVEFSRLSFHNLWKIGSKFESALEPVTKAMSQILFTAQDVGFIDHLLNEAVVGVEVLLRRYRNHKALAEIFAVVVKAHERISKAESLVALLNLLPEFPQAEAEAQKIIQKQVENYVGLSSEVQLACLSAAIRLFTVDPDRYAELVPQLLDTIDRNVDNPDIRDRAFIYWRLLDVNPELARTVVMGSREPVEHVDTNAANKELFDELFDRIGGIAATLQDPTFLNQGVAKQMASMANLEEATPKAKQNKEDDILQLDNDDFMSIEPPKDVLLTPAAVPKLPEQPKKEAPGKDNFLDLQFDGFLAVKPAQTPTPPPPTTLPPKDTPKAYDNFLTDLDFSKLPSPLNAPVTAPVPTGSGSASPEQARRSYDEHLDKYSSVNLLHLQTPAPTVTPPPAPLPPKQPEKPAEKVGAFEFEFGDFLGAAAPSPKAKPAIKVEYHNRQPVEVVSAAAKGARGRDGVQIQGTVHRNGQLLFVSLVIDNRSHTPLTDMTFDMKPNPFGLVLRQNEVEGEIHAGSFLKVELPMGFDAAAKTDAWHPGHSTAFPLEFTCNYDTWTFEVGCWLHNLFVCSPALRQTDRRRVQGKLAADTRRFQLQNGPGFRVRTVGRGRPGASVDHQPLHLLRHQNQSQRSE